MAFALKHFEKSTPRFNIVPGESEYARAKCRHFNSLAELAEIIRQEHEPDDYYRGQVRRYRASYYGSIDKLAEAFPGLSPLTIAFESLVPTLFRPVLAANPPDWDSFAYPTPLETITGVVRSIAASAHDALRQLLREVFSELELLSVNNLLITLGADPRGGLPVRVPSTNVCPKLAQLVSLSQHYEFTSSMTDITKDPDVAIWFASHSWSGDIPRDPSVRGVIYRFRAPDEVNRAFTKELFTETGAQLQIFRKGLFGLVDISQLPVELGMRPRNQAGGSLMGLENSVVMHILDAYDAFEVFTFPMTSVTGTETGLPRAVLCPPDDEVFTALNPNAAQNHPPISADELRNIARQLAMSEHSCGVLFRARSMALI
jgi:hypothetical protein